MILVAKDDLFQRLERVCAGTGLWSAADNDDGPSDHELSLANRKGLQVLSTYDISRFGGTATLISLATQISQSRLEETSNGAGRHSASTTGEVGDQGVVDGNLAIDFAAVKTKASETAATAVRWSQTAIGAIAQVGQRWTRWAAQPRGDEDNLESGTSSTTRVTPAAPQTPGRGTGSPLPRSLLLSNSAKRRTRGSAEEEDEMKSPLVQRTLSDQMNAGRGVPQSKAASRDAQQPLDAESTGPFETPPALMTMASLLLSCCIAPRFSLLSLSTSRRVTIASALGLATVFSRSRFRHMSSPGVDRRYLNHVPLNAPQTALLAFGSGVVGMLDTTRGGERPLILLPMD